MGYKRTADRTVTTVAVDRQLWAKFKAVAARDYRSANSLLLALIEKTVQEDEEARARGSA